MPIFKSKLNLSEKAVLKKISEQNGLSLEGQERLKAGILRMVENIPQERVETSNFVFKLKHLGFGLKFASIGAVLIIAMTGTVFAAQAASPGDALYPIKQIKEKVELGIAASPKDKALVKAKHAQERMKELSHIKKEASLQTDGAAIIKQEQVRAVNLETKKQVNKAIKSLKEARKELQNQQKEKESDNLDEILEQLKGEARAHEVEIDAQEFEEDKVEIKNGQKKMENEKRNEKKSRGVKRESRGGQVLTFDILRFPFGNFALMRPRFPPEAGRRAALCNDVFCRLRERASPLHFAALRRRSYVLSRYHLFFNCTSNE